MISQDRNLQQKALQENQFQNRHLQDRHTGIGSPLAGRTVLQIIPTLDAGGAERTTIDIAAALTEAGAHALVASEGGRLISELQARGGVWIPFPAATKNPLRMWAASRRLAELIRQEGIDIVHARSRAPAWVALKATTETGIPMVTTYHGAYSGRSSFKRQYNSIMSRGQRVIANSKFTARRVVDLDPDAKDRVRVIYRGTDLQTFNPGNVEAARVQRLRAEWGIEPDERIVLLAARLTSWKGQQTLIEAARILVQGGLFEVKFVLAGDPQGRTGYVQALDTQIRESGLEGIVVRAGHCSDMPAAFMASSVVTVPSTEPEAFGRSAVEAQAMGTPVVVSDLGAVPETVLTPPAVPDSERTGWTVPAGDAAALAGAIRDTLQLGAAARDALALRARTHVEQNFSLTRMCAATLSVYEEVIADGENRR
ncbi:MAG: glycosyltransferase family 4 protein [Hyphomicrobiales bacterium]|nr:glycosyltransferase family 4 protein [Hyphomicrobiales bacterium]